MQKTEDILKMIVGREKMKAAIQTVPDRTDRVHLGKELSETVKKVKEMEKCIGEQDMHTTIEGDEIKVGECYEIRDGRKVFITDTTKDYGSVRIVQGDYSIRVWEKDGHSNILKKESDLDLMRKWRKE